MNLLEQFIRVLQAQNPAPSRATVKNYKADIAKFIRWFEANYAQFDPKAVTAQIIQAYQSFATQTSPKNDPEASSASASLNRDEELEKLVKSGQNASGQGLALKSFERHLSSLRKFFNFLKVAGHIEKTPFEQIQASQPQIEADPWHLKDFKDHLYVFNASDLTIKNYIIDVKQFLSWTEKVVALDQIAEISKRNIFPFITTELINEYKTRLHLEAGLSPVSINRKLSSLRRFVAWAQAENYISSNNPVTITAEVPDTFREEEVANPLADTELVQPTARIDQTTSHGNTSTQNTQVISTSRYSKIPPIRLFQKIASVFSLGLEAAVITPLAALALKLHILKWQVGGASVFSKKAAVLGPSATKKLLDAANKAVEHNPLGVIKVHNFKKEFYAPMHISTAGMPLHRKTWHHIRHTRPQWYKRYHQNPIVHYFHFAILVVIMTAIGAGMYQAFINDPAMKRASAAPVSPPRILSFQGRLTDASDNPITTAATPLRFAIYDNSVATGSALLWQEIVSVSPDSDGIFSVLLGQNTQFPQTLFGDNAALWLGITVQQTDELAPRQQIATVPYATNSELLQGMAPITQIGAGQTNVVLALDSSGDLTIGGSATPVFQSTGGSFTIQGTTTIISTTAGSNGNVIISPDGTGMIDLQHPVFNSTTGNNKIPSAIGAVEVNDLFAVLATSSGQSAVTINQDGAGPILSASSSGVAKFTILNTGQLIDAAYNTQGGVLYGTSTGLIAQTAQGTATQCLMGGINPSFQSCSSWWDLQNGSLYPINSTVDLLIGGQATTSAKFAVLNVNNGTPVASVSSGVGGNGAYYTADGTFATTNRQSLIIGNSSTYNTTGNVLINPNGTGNVGIGLSNPTFNFEVAGTTRFNGNTTIGDNSGDTLTINGASISLINATTLDLVNAQTSALNVEGGLFNIDTQNGRIGLGTTAPAQRLDVRGSATISATLSLGPLVQSDAGICNQSAAGKIYYDGTFNAYYYCNGTSWTIVGSGSTTQYWDQQNGSLYPLNSTVDFFIGGQATASAKFAVLNMIGSGTPTASISGGVGGNGMFINANGTLGTTNMQTLTMGGSTTGNVLIDSGSGSITLADATTIASNLTVAGTTGITLSGSGADLLFNGGGTNTISSTGTLELGAFTLTGAVTGNNQNVTGLNNLSAAGTITFGSFTNDGGVLFTNGSGVVAQTNVGTATQCLIGGTTPTFSACNVGTADYFWNQANGALFANNSTVDLLIGGQASDSAKFAVLNVNNGTPTASLSAGAAGGFYITANGLLANTAMQSMTIGNSTTGDVIFNPAGNIGIGTFNPLAKLDVNGSATLSGNLTFYGGARTIQSTENQSLTFGGNTTGNIIFSPLNGSGDVRINGTTTFGGQTYTWPGSQTVGGLLSTDGSGGLSWLDALNVGPWTQANGSLFPKNSTVDLLVGGQATASAKFAVLNMNTGTPVASVSSGVGGTGMYITADGTLATTNRQTLILGNSSTYNTTGDILLNPNGTGNIGIGLLTPLAKLDVAGTASLSSSLTFKGGPASIVATQNSDLTIGNAETANLLLTPSGNIGVGTTVPTTKLYVSGSTSSDAFIDTQNSFFFLDPAATATSLTVAGNVGVGTTAPVATMDIRGTAGTIPAASISANTALSAVIVDNRGIGDIFTASSSGQPRFTVKQNGNVDIQTLSAGGIIKSTTPNGTLSIATPGVDYEYPLTFSNGLTRTVNAVTLGGALTGDTDIPLSGFDLTLSGSGNVGIGNTTADQRLQVGDYTNSNYIQVTAGASNGNQAGIRFQRSSSGGNRFDLYMNTFTNTLTLGYNASDKIYFTNDGNIGIGITNPAEKLDVVGNIKVSGTTTFNNDTYTWPTSGTQIAGYVLTSNGSGTLSWADPAGSASNYWLSTNGTLYPKNSTLDFFIGGQSTASAKFAVLNMNNGTPIASISGGVGGNATYITANGVLATHNQRTLTLGDINTGDIVFAPDGSTEMVIRTGGNVGINNANPLAKLDIVGNASVSATLYLSGLAGAAKLETTQFNSLKLGGPTTGDIYLNPKNGSGRIVLSPLTTDGGVLYTDPSGAINSTPNGGSTQCLLGGSNPTWGSCGTGGDNWWNQDPALGLLYTNNSTVDLTIGGQSTDSAKFAVLNMNTGTPVASVSSGVGGTGMFITADGTLATSRRQSLILGNSSTYNSTGNILLNPNGIGYVGIGTYTPTVPLEVSSLSGLASLINRNTTVDNTYQEVLSLRATSNISMVDGFGSTLRFEIADNGGSAFQIGQIGAVRDGADNSGSLVFLPSLTGSLFEAARITPQGRLAVNTTNPLATLDVNANSGTITAASFSATSSLATLVADNKFGDVLAASTSGLTRFVVKQNGNVLINPNSYGNVGIGTSNPVVRLQSMINSINTNQNSITSSDIGLGIYNADTTANNLSILSFGNSFPAGQAYIGSINLGSGALDGGHLILGTRPTSGQPTERMRIDSTGNIGIGRTNPSQRLDVAGSATISATLSLAPILQVDAGVCNPSSAGKIYYQDTNEFYYCNANSWTQFGAGGGTNWFNMALGMLYPINTTLDFALGGTGTSSAKFAVLNMNPGSGTPVASVSSGLGGNSMFFTADGTLATARKQSLVIGNSSTYNTTGNVLIHPSGIGNVGIGTYSATSKLHVVDQNNSGVRFEQYNDADGVNIRTLAARGSIDSPGQILSGSRLTALTGFGYTDANTYSNAAAQIGFWASEGFTTSGNGTYIDFRTTPNGSTTVVERMRIDNAGNVGVGTTTPLAKFHVNSNLGTAPAASVSANSNSFAGMVINQDGLGSILTASVSGATKFTITNLGDVVAAGQIRMGNYTTAQASTLTPVGQGALYYNTDLNTLFISHDGTTWSNLSGQDTIPLTNNSGGSVPQYSIVVLDLSMDSAFTATTSAYSKQVIGVTNSATCAAAATCLVTISGKTSVRIANDVTRGEYLYTSTTTGQAFGSPNQTDGMLGVALTSGSAGGTVDVQLMPQLSNQATAAIDKGSKHNQYRLAVNDYEETNTGTDPDTNPTMRELFFDNFMDSSKVGTNSGVGGPWQTSSMKNNTSTGPNTPVAPYRVGLSGGQTYSTSTSDNNGLTYLGSNTVNDIHYYDRTRDSSPATLVNLGIDPNWYNGVTLAVGSSSANFSQNDTNYNQQVNPNLSTSYNGSLVLVSGQMNTSVANPAKTVSIMVKSFTSSTITFDWSDGSVGRQNNTYTFGQLTQLQTQGGTNTGVFVRFMKSAKYNVGDVFRIASWYIENTTGSTTRGPKAQFPERSYLVATSSTVEIIDADTQKLWMRFTVNTATPKNMINSNTVAGQNAITMLNGQLYVGGNNGQVNDTGVSFVRFTTDYGGIYYNSAEFKYNGSIGERNASANITNLGNRGTNIVSTNINDIAAAVIPNHPTKTVTVSGWGYIVGDDTQNIEENVNFPYKFNTIPTVQVTDIGARPTSSGAPSTASDCSTQSVQTAAAYTITTSGFQANELQLGGTMASTYYWCYSWTATGEVSPRQYVAVATGTLGADGGTTVINETDQTSVNIVVGSQSGATIWQSKVALTSRGELYSVESIAGGADYIMVYRNIGGLTSSESSFFQYGSGYYQIAGSSGTFTPAPIGSPTSNTLTSLHVTQGTSTIDGKSNTLYIGTGPTNNQYGGVTVLQEKQSFGATLQDGQDEDSGSVKYYTAPTPSGTFGGYVSEEMVGDIRGMWPLAANTNLSMANTSVKGTTLDLTNNGTVTATTGVRGVGGSFNGTSQYLSCADGTCGGTTLLDYTGSGGWTWGAWVNPTSISGNRDILTKATSGDLGYELALISGVPACLATNTAGSWDATRGSSMTLSTGQWYHIVCVYNASTTTLDVYVNGIYTNSTLTGSVPASIRNSGANFTIGATAIPSQYFSGSIDEPFVTASALSGQKIKQMYNVGYRALQGHSPSAILGNLNADQNQQLSGSTTMVADVKPDFMNQYMYVSSSNSSGGAGISQMDLNSDTLVKQFRSSGNNPTGGTTPINTTVGALAVGYNLEAASASTAGMVSFAPDNNANGTSGTYTSASFQALETFSQAYVWLQANIDTQDGSNGITVYLSNNDGASYQQCNLSNTDSNQSPPEYEYFCQLNTPGDDLKVQFAMNRGSTKTNTYITRYGVAWIDSNAQALNQASTGFYTNTNNTVANGGYLEVAHNQGTYDLLTNGWIYDNGVWKQIDGSYKAAYMWEGKDSLRLDLLQEALLYRPSNETDTYTNNLIERGFLFDTFEDGSKFDATNSATAILQPFKEDNGAMKVSQVGRVQKGRAGLTGNMIANTTNTDSAGNAYLGSATVNKIFYYDRPVRDSSSEVMVNLGIDPNWANGVTLTVATTSASFSQNDTNNNQSNNPNLSTSYNGSLVQAQGRYTSNARPIYITVNSASGSATFNWTDYNGNQGNNWDLQTGKWIALAPTGVSVKFTGGVTYNTGDVFKIASWYTEPTSSSRGNKQSFPERSYVIANGTNVNIIDADTQRLWMNIDTNTLQGQSQVSVTMLNGRLYSVSPVNFMHNYHFDTDAYYAVASTASSGYYRGIGAGIAQRSNGGYRNIDPSYGLISNSVNDVTAAVIPNQPTGTITYTGWGYIPGNGTAAISESVQLKYKFNQAPIVTIDIGGSAPTTTTINNIADCAATTLVGGVQVSQIEAYGITTSSFTAAMATSNANAYSVANNYCYRYTVTGEVSPRQYVAVAQGTYATSGDGVSNGGISILNETDQSVVQMQYSSSFDYVPKVALANDGTLYSLMYSDAYYEMEVKYGIAGLNTTSTIGGANGYRDYIYTAGNTSGNYINYSNTTNMPVTSLHVTSGTSTIDGVSNTIYVSTERSGLAVIQEKQSRGNTAQGNASNLQDGSEEKNGSVKYYTAQATTDSRLRGYVTEEMVGPIRGMWPLNSIVGTSDATAFANTLTNNNGVTYVSGVRGTGMSFNGSNQYLSCTDAACGGTTETDIGSGSMTWGAWIKTSSATRGDIMSKGTTAQYSYEFMVQADGTLRMALMQSSGAMYLNASTSTSSPLYDNKWHHVAAVFNQNVPRLDLYVDGILAASSTSTAGSLYTDSTADFEVGRRNDGSFYFNGTIDEPFVTGTAISGQKIRQMYETGYRALQSHTNGQGGSGVDANQQLAGTTAMVADGKPDYQNQFMYVSSSNSTSGGAVSKIDLNSDTLVKNYNNSANVPSGGNLMVNSTNSSLAVGYDLEAVSASTAGVLITQPSNASYTTSGTFYSKSYALPNAIASAVVWVKGWLDPLASDSLTVAATANAGIPNATYDTCTLVSTNNDGPLPEREYACDLSSGGSNLQMRFTFNRQSATGGYNSNNYITEYGVSWLGQTGFKIEQTTNNTVRLYNYSGLTQDLRLDVVTGLTQSGSSRGWVSLAPNVADVDSDSFTNSIWINKTGDGGTLMKLQVDGNDFFTLTPSYGAAPATASVAANLNPMADNTYTLGASSSARWKDAYLGPSSLHIQCKPGDGAGCADQTLDWSLGITTSTGNFQIRPNSSGVSRFTILKEGGIQSIATVSAQQGSVRQNFFQTNTGGNGSGNFVLGLDNFVNTTTSYSSTGGIYGFENAIQVGALGGTGTAGNVNQVTGLLLSATQSNGAIINENRGIWISTLQGNNVWGIYDSSGGKWYAAGNVGIGNTNPTTALYVNGVATANSFVDAQNSAYFFDGAATGTSLTTAGNVGIGSSAPGYRLEVYNGFTAVGLYNTNTIPPSNASGGMILGWNRSQGGAEMNIYNGFDNATRSFQFSQKTGVSTYTDLMTIMGNGNVGIGSTAPTGKLQVTQSASGINPMVGFNQTNSTVNGGTTLHVSSTNDTSTWPNAEVHYGILQDHFLNGTFTNSNGRYLTANLFRAGWGSDNSNVSATQIINLQLSPNYGSSFNSITTNYYSLFIDGLPAQYQSGVAAGGGVAYGYAIYSGYNQLLDGSSLNRRWNIYAAGTAPNYFAGNVGIGTNAPNSSLQVGGSDAIVMGQLHGDNSNTIQTYIDGQWSNRASYAGGCCNKLYLQPDVGEVGIGTTTSTQSLQKLTVRSSDNTETTNIAGFYANNMTVGIGIGYYNVRQITAGQPIYINGGTTGAAHVGNVSTGGVTLAAAGGNVSIGAAASTFNTSGQLLTYQAIFPGHVTGGPGQQASYYWGYNAASFPGYLYTNTSIVSAGQYAAGNTTAATIMNSNQFYCNNAAACHFNWSGTGHTYVGNAAGLSLGGALNATSITASGAISATGAIGSSSSVTGNTIVSATFPAVASPSQLCRSNVNALHGSCASDIRLKKNVISMGDALSVIGQLRPVTFNWKADDSHSYGFIAQEVLPVFPDAVNMSTDGYYGLNDLQFTPLLAKGIQELDLRTASQAGQISQLNQNMNNVYTLLDAQSGTQSGQLANLMEAMNNLALENTDFVAIMPNASPSATKPFMAQDGFGNPITNAAAYSQAAIANLRVGMIDAQLVKVGGQTLQAYIISVVQNAGFSQQNGPIIAPIAQIDRVYTNALSPLAGSNFISIDANLQVNGSAIISGTLTAKSATIGGTLVATRVEGQDGLFETLRARNIVADNIQGLSSVIATMAAQTITNITNVYQSTPSGSSIYATEDATRSALLASLATLPNGQMASYSGTLANVMQVTAEFGTFNQGLIALGPSSFTDVGVAGQLSIGGSMILANNSINTLGSDLQIQPLRQGGISIMAGLIHINTDGDITFGGAATFNKDARFNGKIIGRVISPIPDEDLIISLGNDAMPSKSRFVIKNSSGSAVFAVNGAGDVTASGSATFAKLNLNIIKKAVATGSGDLLSFGTAGVATISATRSEITIHNAAVTKDSLIYITPVGTPSAQGTYLMRQKPGESFTVGGAANSVFNWLIVN